MDARFRAPIGMSSTHREGSHLTLNRQNRRIPDVKLRAKSLMTATVFSTCAVTGSGLASERSERQDHECSQSSDRESDRCDFHLYLFFDGERV